MAIKCILDSATKKVINIIELEENAKWHPSSGTELAPQHDGNIGDTWDGIKFVNLAPSESVQLQKPTKEELLAQLQALQTQIQALE